MTVYAFLPCRAGSERVPKKNIKPFSIFKNGLIEVKLKQLIGCSLIDKIILSTNDIEILDYANSLKNDKISTHQRESSLCSSTTSTDELVAHAISLIPKGHILWTHVTSPFINSTVYEEIILNYYQSLANGYDSLMTITELRAFLWQNDEPYNYDRTKEKWPRTQTIKPIQEINSGAFLASADIYRKCNDRIGTKPLLYPLERLISHDIDWPDDFILAESIADKGIINL